MNSALLLASVDTLVGCKDLEELASGVALLGQRLFGTANATVILRNAEREFVSGAASPGGELQIDKLRSWASEWLATLPARRQASSGGRQAAGIDVAELDVHGVIAVSFGPEGVEPEGGASEDRASEDRANSARTEQRPALLAALAALAATCSAQIVRRTLADRTLQDTRALMARGLHDLCTPLNSLRLGMHLLEPALTTKDPAIAQRAHRAVDRMAALVTSLADAIGSGGAAQGQRGASVSSAS
jgi:signal transduction histidine kinase